MTELAPVYIKQTCKGEPSFRDAKVVFSVYDDEFQAPVSEDFTSKLMLKGITKKDVESVNNPVDYKELCKLAIQYSDGVIQNSPTVNAEIMDYARESGKLVLDYPATDDYANACNNFYDEVWANAK